MDEWLVALGGELASINSREMPVPVDDDGLQAHGSHLGVFFYLLQLNVTR